MNRFSVKRLASVKLCLCPDCSSFSGLYLLSRIYKTIWPWQGPRWGVVKADTRRRISGLAGLCSVRNVVTVQHTVLSSVLWESAGRSEPRNMTGHNVWWNNLHSPQSTRPLATCSSFSFIFSSSHLFNLFYLLFKSLALCPLSSPLAAAFNCCTHRFRVFTLKSCPHKKGHWGGIKTVAPLHDGSNKKVTWMATGHKMGHQIWHE